MDPTKKHRISTHNELEIKSNSPELNSTSNNPLKKHRTIAKTQMADQAVDGSMKNVKSEVESKFSGGNPVKRPPPPKYPAPLPPFGSVGMPPPHPTTPPPDFPSAADLGKPPPHPTTPPPDFPSAADLGKPPPHPTTPPPDFPSTTDLGKPLSHPATPTPDVLSPIQVGNFSHPVIDTKVYSQDMPLITISGAQKIPYRETSKISKKELAAEGLRFSTYEQDEFYAEVAKNPKSLELIDQCNLSEKEVAALNAYTKNKYYDNINNQFRHLPLDQVDISDENALINAGVQNIELAELIAALIKGMRKLPPAQTSDSAYLPLGRSVTMYQDELDCYVNDAEIISHTFLSTTTSATSMVSRDVGFYDRKDIALIIYQRVNGNARDISPFSNIPDEQEILFMPNTKFKVMSRSDPVEVKSSATKEEVEALKALSNQELYEQLKSEAGRGVIEAQEALYSREFSDELLYKPGEASNAKNTQFESNGGVLKKIFISIMEIPLDSSSELGS